MNSALVCLVILFGNAPEDGVPVPMDPPAAEAALPELPDLSFEEDGNGNVTIRKADLIRHLQAEIALKRAARAEVQKAREDVQGATHFVQEQNALRQAEIAQQKEQAQKLHELHVAMQQMQLQAKATWDQLVQTRHLHQQTAGELQSAQYQIAAAHAEIERQRRLAWVPAPISTVIKLFSKEY